MDQFPRWMRRWMSGDDGSATHGLNLALPLRNPAELPLLLWDIAVGRPKIELAMQELSFLHYARFVPSWDASALMVLTEFDGPLEPYVMDFVIAIGDVFDTILSYVEGGEGLRPVREHPREFWEFVQYWNRVPFAPRLPYDSTLFPPDFEYPIYNAYPDRTVIDVVGKRTKLLAPAIDHPAAYVDLDDVQGNILKGYRATAVTHRFFEITDREQARKWLSTQLPDGANVPGQAWGGVMSAQPWPRDARGFIEKPKLMTNVAFTFEGLKVLLPEREADLSHFPVAFQEGAAGRSQRNGDVGEKSAPAGWRFGRSDQRIHVVVSLYTIADPQVAFTVESQLLPASSALQTDAQANGMRQVWEETAQALPGNAVYFGYRDGIARPRISGQCNEDKQDRSDYQPAASPGEFLLGRRYRSIYGGCSLDDMPADLAENGTFGVMRLLEQDVAQFERMLAKPSIQEPIDPRLLQAKVLGRWRDGQPLARYPDVDPGGEARDDFDYAPSWEHPDDVEDDHEGRRCPVGAHIRRTNPRTARVAGQRHSRRLLRRGMPMAWKEGEQEKKGLMGLFLGASIERQFEFIQQQWIQGGSGAQGLHGTTDPIAGIRSAETTLAIPGHGTLRVPPLVATRGCLYLFFPSIGMLRRLGAPDAAVDVQAVDAVACNTASLAGMDFLQDPDLQEAFVNLAGLDDAAQWLKDLLSGKWLDSEVVESLVRQFAPERKTFQPKDPPDAGKIRPLDPRFIANPFPAYAELRAQHRSVVWVPEHHAYWVLGRAEAQRLFAEPANFLQAPSGTELRGIISMDDPRHAQVRAILDPALRTAAGNIDAWVEEAALAALDRIGPLQQFDFIPAYGQAVPRTVFWRVLGVRDDDQAACDALAQAMMLHYGQPPRPGMADGIVFADASLRLTVRLAWMLAKALVPIGNPYEGTLIGELARATRERKLDPRESVLTLVQMVLAGYMSSQFHLGTALRNLLRADPRAGRNGEVPWTQLAKLRQASKADFDTALGTALAEARRVDPPVTIVERYAAADGIKLGGVVLEKDCPVHAVVASANREVEDGPEEFHWDRQPALENLSLGFGIHHCIGAWLQAKIVPAALALLIDRMPDLRLCDDRSVPAWYDNIYFRALQSLAVTRCA